MVLIPNTLELTTLWVTRRARDRGPGSPGARASRREFRPIPFDREGNLEQEELFPESQRAAEASILIRAVVFDLDGLMFDTEALFFRVASEALADRGKAFTPEIMKQFIGRRAAEVVESWKTLAGVEEPVEDFLADVEAAISMLVMDTVVHPMPGLFVLLDRLHRAGRFRPRWRPRRGMSYADRLLVRHGIRDRFAFVLASEDVTRGKPDPEIYQLAAVAVPACQPSRCWCSKIARRGWPPPREPAPSPWEFRTSTARPRSLGTADLVVARLDDPALLLLIESPNREPDTDERPH